MAASQQAATRKGETPSSSSNVQFAARCSGTPLASGSLMKANDQFVVGPDETGAIVLYVLAEDGRAIPVSQQCGTWRRWVDATDALSAEPGALLPVELTQTLSHDAERA
jgi:hypothetical protein